MCGIFGIASLDRAPVAGLSARLSTLRDRGPDNVGEARFDHVALFHTRLAVIDAKEMSNQPLRGDGIALVCNGEILNHSDLREEGGSYRYLTPSDCEAVIDVYARLGIEGFGRLDGFFAFALFDSRREVLILHRDNVGKKPLFWTSDGRRVLLASNVTTLLENLELTPPVDRGQIPFLLRNGFVDPRASLFHGIRPVLPGQVVEIDLRTGRIAERRLDKPWRRYDGFDWKDERLVQRTIEELLHDSCAKRARGLRAPVLILSGGVDSTVLAHELVKLSSGTQLVTLKQPVRWLNDEPYAREAARSLGRPLLFARLPLRPFPEVRSLVRKLDQPLSLLSYVFLALLAVEARRFGNVLFTGDGADEVFFGYRGFDEWEGVAPGDDSAAPLVSGPPFGFPLSRYGRTQGVLDLVGHAFMKVDKATAENAMEARCPFLDWDLMAFVRQVPAAYWRAQGRRLKRPLRDYLLARGVPRAFVERKKLGFAFPFRYLLAPSLPAIRAQIHAGAGVLRDLGVEVDFDESPWASFRSFQRTWAQFVLADYFARIARAPVTD
ncbi:MAG TPA: asparagine synthase-related protein [Polyangiaceae bacterium]|nr:asparagine synthase-related protein [Polyangiaceae bacterium]